VRSRHHPVFLGIGGHAVALDRATGTELWRRKLKMGQFTTVLFDGHSLLAAGGGEVFCIDPSTGEVLWHNKLPRLGHGVISFGGDTTAVAAAAARQAAARAAAGG
jgi:outer membrane protein assembly factor BamB